MKETEQELIAESSATRIAISALVSTVREMFFSHMYDARKKTNRLLVLPKKVLINYIMSLIN